MCLIKEVEDKEIRGGNEEKRNVENTEKEQEEEQGVQEARMRGDEERGNTEKEQEEEQGGGKERGGEERYIRNLVTLVLPQRRSERSGNAALPRLFVLTTCFLFIQRDKSTALLSHNHFGYW